MEHSDTKKTQDKESHPLLSIAYIFIAVEIITEKFFTKLRITYVPSCFPTGSSY